MNTTIYNPANKRKEQLIDEFVVRTDVFESIIDDLRKTLERKTAQHYLIIGQRGSGKTTLIHRLKYSIEDDKSLSTLIPIALGEEQYGISELVNLWEKIAEILEDYYNFNKLYDHIQDEINDSEDEKKCLEILIKELKSKNKKIVLFIDNFGDLLDKLSNSEVISLKETLSKSDVIRIIAASPITPENAKEQQIALFSLFKNIFLRGLDNNEIETLLLKLSETNNSKQQIQKIIDEHPERIEILRLLTGGITRTIVSLYKIFIDNIGGKSIRDLQLTLDAVTPLYKHNMDDLPKNQQKIVDVVAKSWDATNVKDIAKKTRIESKIVSAQISQLEKKQIIEKIPTGKKNHLYQIKERFFNIWYLMRYGRKYDKKRVIWLVRFLESWCTKEELESRISSYIHSLKIGEYDDDAAVLLGEAYLGCEAVNIYLKKELLLESKEILPENLTKGMTITDQELFKNAFDFYKKNEFEKGISLAFDITKKDNNLYGFIVNSYYQIDDFENVIKYSDLIIENDADDGVVFAVKGSAQYSLGLYEESVKTLEIAIKNNANEAYFELGYIYLKEDEFDLAEEHLKKALDFDLTKNKALHHLGHLYDIKNDKINAIASFKEAIKLGNNRAKMCLAKFYDYNDDVKESIFYYKEAIQHYPEEASIGLARLLLENDEETKGLKYLNKIKNSENDRIQSLIALVYHRYADNPTKAISHYKKAIKLGNEDAYHKIAHIYEQEDNFLKAEDAYMKSYELNDDYEALLCLANMYNHNNVQIKNALSLVETAKENIDFDFGDKIFYAIILLANNQLEKSIDVFNDILFMHKGSIYELDINNETEDEDTDDDYSDGLIEYFIELISYNHFEQAYELIIKNDLNEILKPIYFALMFYMKEEFPDEYLKMGNEIKEIVEEIVENIELRKNKRK